MAQASSSWRQLINQIPNWSFPEINTGRPKQRNFQRFSGPGGVLGFLTIIVAMLFWNWKLLLALGVGISIMRLTYSMQDGNWQKRWFEIQKHFHGFNRRLALAVGGGGIATVSTYIAAAIWVDSTSPWIAAGMIVQGIGTLFTLVLLVWQIFSLYANRETDQLDQLLMNLTAKDPLQRLIAVRQLTKFANHQGVDSSTQQDIVQCLRLLLSREEEAVIRQAAFNSLQALDSVHILPSIKRVSFTPVSAKVKDRISVE